MSHIIFGYVRVSTDDQTTENQRRLIAEKYPTARFYADDAVSGTVLAANRPGLSRLLEAVHPGDTLVVVAIDRLGRNTIDVLSTVEALKSKGVAVVSLRENFDLTTPAGTAMLAMMAAMAQLEKDNIKARQLAGLQRARAENVHLGRVKTIVDADVVRWREANQASIKQTSEHFKISTASVKRACANVKAMAA